MVGLKRKIKSRLKYIRNVVINLFSLVSSPFFSEKISLSEEECKDELSRFCPDCGGKVDAENKISEKPEYDLQIIIPAYNVEKYIEKCIDSCLNQKTKYSYKIVIVNDGSKDNTGKILEKYSSIPYIDIITQENKGFSGARNTALANIDSKYIMFLDSDDILYDGAVENLLGVAFEKNAEIVEGGFTYLYSDDQAIGGQISGAPMKVTPALGNLEGYPCGKVIKSELFANFKFPDGYWFEDTFLSFLIFPIVKEAYIIPQTVYIYRKNNQSSITSSFIGNRKSLDSVYIMWYLMEEHEKRGYEFDGAYLKKICRQLLMNYRRVHWMDENIQKSYFYLTCKYFNKYVPKNANSFMLYGSLIKFVRNYDFGNYIHFMKLIYPDLGD